MTITFNNIPATVRTYGVYGEIDNSRALTGLAQNPHKALIIGTGLEGVGTVSELTLTAITRDNLADGYYGAGSDLARMVNKFKENNPNTELYALRTSDVVSTAGAIGAIYFSAVTGALSELSTTNGNYFLMINGVELEVTVTSGWSATDIASATLTKINGSQYSALLGVTASNSMGSTAFGDASVSNLYISAVTGGTPGNYLNIRENYYTGQSYPTGFGSGSIATPSIKSMGSVAVGGSDPDLGNCWTLIENEQFHYVIQPYVEAANLTEIEDELEDRFEPLNDKQGHGFTAYGATQADCTTKGNSRNSPHNTIIGVYDSPTSPAEWAAAWGAKAAYYLNIDPARPLHTIKLDGILPPPKVNEFTRAERDTLLYDGIATWTVNSGGYVQIERSITTYQANALGLPDWSYLDIQTLATIGEIRYQTKTRMSNRYMNPRFKLADDDQPVWAGGYVVRPKDIKEEYIALFTELRDKGWIENLDDFIDNIQVERDATDVNRVNALLPFDLINQFRILAEKHQFIL